MRIEELEEKVDHLENELKLERGQAEAYRQFILVEAR